MSAVGEITFCAECDLSIPDRDLGRWIRADGAQLCTDCRHTAPNAETRRPADWWQGPSISAFVLILIGIIAADAANWLLIGSGLMFTAVFAVYSWAKASVAAMQERQESAWNNRFVPQAIPRPHNVPARDFEEVCDQVISAIARGEQASQFPTVAILKPTERLVFDIPGVKLSEERVTRVPGGSGGVSVRLTKGVYVRAGGYNGAPRRELTEIDEGHFVLTSQRIRFIGPRTSLNIPLEKVSAITPLNHGIALSREGKTRTEYFDGFDLLEVRVTAAPDEGDNWPATRCTWRMNGEQLKKLIELLIAE